jgi:hypothetical protein
MQLSIPAVKDFPCKPNELGCEPRTTDTADPAEKQALAKMLEALKREDQKIQTLQRGSL